MLEQQVLGEFDRRLRAETSEMLAVSHWSSGLARTAALAEVMIGYPRTWK